MLESDSLQSNNLRFAAPVEVRLGGLDAHGLGGSAVTLFEQKTLRAFLVPQERSKSGQERSKSGPRAAKSGPRAAKSAKRSQSQSSPVTLVTLKLAPNAPNARNVG